MKKLAIIGECMLELSGEMFGTMRQFYGGDSLNTATYLTRITQRENIDVAYITAIGCDPLSRKMCSFWQQDGINTDFVLQDPHRLAGLYLIQLDCTGERTFLNWRSDSAARYLLQHPDYSRVATYLSQCDAIYLTGISLAILPNDDRFKLIHQLKTLAKQGVKIVFDSNYRPTLWENQQAAQSAYAELLPYVDLALLTAEDEMLLWHDSDLNAITQRLKSFNIPQVVIKAGKQGAYTVSADGQTHHIPTIPIKTVIDTTSAGDSFNAGFLAGYLNNKSIEQCCQQGNQLAGIVIQHKGAIIPKDATAHLHSQFH